MRLFRLGVFQRLRCRYGRNPKSQSSHWHRSPYCSESYIESGCLYRAWTWRCSRAKDKYTYRKMTSIRFSVWSVNGCGENFVSVWKRNGLAGSIYPESKDKYGQTPLSWAARDGIDPNSKDKKGRTPLSLAAQRDTMRWWGSYYDVNSDSAIIASGKRIEDCDQTATGQNISHANPHFMFLLNI